MENLAEGIFNAVNALLDFYYGWLGLDFILMLKGLFAKIYAGHPQPTE